MTLCHTSTVKYVIMIIISRCEKNSHTKKRLCDPKNRVSSLGSTNLNITVVKETYVKSSD
ncbi:unnamed protein product [Tenebrio molitor]|nr:unnamed protein product [Tenebrio molitor]